MRKFKYMHVLKIILFASLFLDPEIGKANPVIFVEEK